MDRATAIFVEGMGAATAASGVLTQLQGRIFGYLYLHPAPVSLDEITTELGISKGNVSVNIRGLVEWHLVRRVSVPGSRKDHYEAATDFWRRRDGRIQSGWIATDPAARKRRAPISACSMLWRRRAFPSLSIGASSTT